MLTVAWLSALILAATAGSPVREHGPIPLYQRALLSPPEAAGSGLRPLVRAKLVIDTSGRVVRVDVTSVEPSSSLDEAFRAAARGALSSWRFAAAEKGGVAVSSESSVALQFDPQDMIPRERTALFNSGAAAERAHESSRYDSRAKILALEASARKQVGDEFAAKAEALLKKGQRVAAVNDWFEVVTDFGGQKQADAILQNVGATYAALFAVLGERIPPLPREARIRVYVFETSAQYKTLVENTTPFEGSAGIYSPAGVLAFHAQHPTLGYFMAIMLHESTHAFVDRHLARRGVLLPRWLDEGLAEYVANSDIKGGKLVAGGHAKRKELSLARGGVVFWQSVSRLSTEEAKRAQRQKRALALGEIIAAGPETFYGKDFELYYSQGWLAVHFLRHGRPEWTEGAFPKFLLYVAEGYQPDQAFVVSYGVEAAELEAAYQRYVKTF